MIDKENLNQQLPMNFSSDVMSEYYCDNGQMTYRKFSNIILYGDIFEISRLYDSMSAYFIANTFKKGSFMVMHEGYYFVEMVKKTKHIRETLKEMKINIKCFNTQNKYDMQVIVLPFDNIDDMDCFGYIIRNFKFVEYWKDGEYVGDNMKYLTTKENL